MSTHETEAARDASAPEPTTAKAGTKRRTKASAVAETATESGGGEASARAEAEPAPAEGDASAAADRAHRAETEPEGAEEESAADDRAARAEAEPEGAGGEASAADDRAARAEAERKRLEEQLAMLERKQAEVRRALAIADHPSLGEAIREIEGRIYRASKLEERLAHPLSKSEARQRDKLDKKLEAARAKRAELDATIAALEGEREALGDARLEGLRAEHEGAIRALFTSLAQHADAFEAAGLQVTILIPELAPWLPALRAMADEQASVHA